MADSNSKTKRKPISKKMRFEIFKRDNFTCQYCGESAPKVILELDHIVPVCKGGKNELTNLVTSCMSCNRGKGGTPLSDTNATEIAKRRLEEMALKSEQLAMMMKWRQELLKTKEKQINMIETIITNGEYYLKPEGRNKISFLISKYEFNQVYDAAMLSLRYNSIDQRMNKIGGICYNRKWKL